MGDRSEKFTGKVADRTHTIVLHAEPDTVFPLFGPIREAEWAAGWEPRIVAGDGQAPARGCVFRTTDHERGETVWLLVQLDVEKRRIGYVRTTPLSDLAEISIGIEQRGRGSPRLESATESPGSRTQVIGMSTASPRTGTAN